MDTQAQASVLDNAELLPLSKNKQKKMKRDQEWEANSAKRKAKRKEKNKEKKQRKRTALEESDPFVSSLPKSTTDLSQENSKASSSIEPSRTRSFRAESPKKVQRSQHIQLPITLVLDCSFDDLMMDKERKSLGSQITRCYSDNHKAPYQAHLAVSSFGGHLKERFDGLLAGMHHSWKGVRFLEGDFQEAAEQSNIWMKGEDGGKLAGVFAESGASRQTLAELAEAGEVVYLTSDSPNTLNELRPYSTYIIGGLVDRNRHKGICYKKAMDRGMKTAKLPIGDYMQMTSRFVLATNHVAEIILRWLELGDWGEAFLKVVPKRKGGVLRRLAGEANRKPHGEVSDDEKDQMDEEAPGAEQSLRTEGGRVNVEEMGNDIGGDSGSDAGGVKV